MPTPINTVIDLIATTWAAVTPPDRVLQRYYHAALEAPDPAEQSAHRSFWFQVAERGEPILETSAGVVVPYVVQAVMVLDCDGRTPGQERAALLNEASLLMRAVDLVADAAWPAGTVSTMNTGAVTFKPYETISGSTAYVVTFEFSVEVEET